MPTANATGNKCIGDDVPDDDGDAEEDEEGEGRVDMVRRGDGRCGHCRGRVGRLIRGHGKDVDLGPWTVDIGPWTLDARLRRLLHVRGPHTL